MYLITGASSGLGAALAHLYAKEGHNLCLTGRDRHKLDKVAKGAKAQQSSGGHESWIHTMPANLNQDTSVSALLDSLPEAPKWVIHCAGSGYFGPLTEQKTQNITALIDNNLLSTIFLLRELIRRYQDEAIQLVVVMSTAALVGKGGREHLLRGQMGRKRLSRVPKGRT